MDNDTTDQKNNVISFADFSKNQRRPLANSFDIDGVSYELVGMEEHSLVLFQDYFSSVMAFQEDKDWMFAINYTPFTLEDDGRKSVVGLKMHTGVTIQSSRVFRSYQKALTEGLKHLKLLGEEVSDDVIMEVWSHDEKGNYSQRYFLRDGKEFKEHFFDEE